MNQEIVKKIDELLELVADNHLTGKPIVYIYALRYEIENSINKMIEAVNE